MSQTIAIPIWVICLLVMGMSLTFFSLWATRQGEKAADHITAHLILVVKSLLLQRRQKQVYIANCYLVQSDDVGLYFTMTGGDGINVILSDRKP